MENLLKDNNEEIFEEPENAENTAASKQKKPKFFTYERALFLTTLFFGLWFLASVIAGATNKYHNYYDEAQARLVIIQNLRLSLILLIPYVLEKFFGLRVELKILIFFYLFAFVAAVIGETFKVYYRAEYFDKTLHAISGFIALYFGYGFAYLILKNGTGNHKFLAALTLGFLAAAGVAAIWELLEFTTDLIFGTNMQKIIPPELFNGGNSYAELSGTDQQIAEFFRRPEGYKYALMDSMWDMLVAFIASVFFAIVMAVVKKFNKNAFENCVIYDPDLRMAKLRNKNKSGKTMEITIKNQ